MRGGPRAVLLLVVLATLLANLEVGLVNVALPTLAAAFSVEVVTVQWVALAYQLTIIGTLLLFGLLVVVVEQRQEAPLIDLLLLAHWRLAAGLVIAWLTFIALASNMFLIPFVLQAVLGYSAARAGLVMMVVPLMIVPIAPLAGALADRYGSRLPATVGLAATVVAILGMAQLQPATPLWFTVAVLALYGVGAGLFQAPNNRAVLSAAPIRRTESVSGMLALARNLGQVVGVAIASTVWTWRQTHYTHVAVSPGASLAAGLRDALLVLAGVRLLALFIMASRRDAQGAPHA